ncbi:MAG: thioredoxin [Gemmatimonadaceae bacterium]
MYQDHLTLRCQFCSTWNRVDTTRIDDRPKCGKCERPMLLDRPWLLDEDSFARTISESELPILVDFYADWCGPCKKMAPAIDELARKYRGKALVAKLNTDLAPKTSERFQIRSIPTVMVFRGNQEVARVSGGMPLAALEKLIESAAVKT